MVYLPRQERRAEIIEAVLRIAANEGFAAATARRIGAELKMAPSNLHHVFASQQAMKNEAFQYFDERERAKIQTEVSGLSPIETLVVHLIEPDVKSDQMGSRIWIQALSEAGRDPAFGEVYYQAIATWHGHVAGIIAELRPRLSPGQAEASAWRLLAVSMGLSSFARIAGFPMSAADVVDHVRSAIAQELSAADQSEGGT